MSPVTSLLALLALIAVSIGLTIGLTYAPCYSSLCSEEPFPYETRVHIAVFYALLASLALFFLLWSRVLALQTFSKKPIWTRRLPLLSARITYGGAFTGFWILLLVLITTALWLEVKPWWNDRLQALSNWQDAATSAIVTTIIGHHIDMILGLVIIPVPRHSAICETFGMPSSTLLWAHKALAYLLLVGMVAHAAAYFSFIAALVQNSSAAQATVSLLNPYFANGATARLGEYSLVNFPSGIITLVLIIIITVTALAWFRRRHYEIFYYLHIVLGILFMAFACIHASTNFYCLVPGLLLWAYDWTWRFFGGSGLSHARIATVQAEDNGWFRVSMLPSEKVSHHAIASTDSMHPLQTYYLNLPKASKIQCHAMTTISSQADDSEIQFLFSECSSGSKSIAWTERVGELSGLEQNQTTIRLEGPYISRIPAMHSASHIVCIVGGTGITGALSIADWWLRGGSAAEELTIVWSIRNAETIRLAEWEKLQAIAKERSSLHLLSHVTSKQGRMEIPRTIQRSIEDTSSKHSRTWVYVSGPEGLLNDAEDACLALQKEMDREKTKQSLDCYAARWEV